MAKKTNRQESDARQGELPFEPHPHFSGSHPETGLIPLELKSRLAGGIDRMPGASATLIIRQEPTPTTCIQVGPLSLTFAASVNITEPALTVYGLRCEEIPRIAMSSTERVMGGVVVRSSGWSRMLQAESYDPEIIPLPPNHKWAPMPPIAHVAAILPFAETCFCEDPGVFTAATLHASATTRPPTLYDSDEHGAIVTSSRALLAALKADQYTHVCVHDDRVWLRGKMAVASISHVAGLSGLNADVLKEMSLEYPVHFKIYFEEDIQDFPFPEPGGALRFKGGDKSGRVESDYKGIPFKIETSTPPFDFVVTNVEGVRPLLLNRTCEIYVPPQANRPVGFRMGACWYWSVSLPE